MSEKNNGLLKPAIAVAVGIIVGAALSSRGGEGEIVLRRQIEALQTQIAETVAATEQRIAALEGAGPDLAPVEARIAALEGATPDLSGVEGAVAAVTARVDEVEAALKAEVADLAAAQEGLVVLREQMAGLAARIATLTMQPAN